MNEINSNSRIRLHGLWALTNRELKKWYKAPVILFLSIVQPIIWMALLGKVIDFKAIIPADMPLDSSEIMMSFFGVTDYFSYMSVGMVVFTALFTSMFSGMSVVWDRRLGFLNKVLSTPVSRSVIILSKLLSATLRSVFQAAIIILVAVAFGLQFGTTFSIFNLFGVFAIVFLFCMGLSSLFIAINLRSTRIETPMAVMNLLNLPLMFASNALFPITDSMPNYIRAIANINPLSYTTDAVRQLLIFETNYTTLAWDFVYVGIFALIVSTIGIVLSWRFLSK